MDQSEFEASRRKNKQSDSSNAQDEKLSKIEALSAKEGSNHNNGPK